MTQKIIIFAPDRLHDTLEKTAAKVSLVGSIEQLTASIKNRVADMVLLLNLPPELRRRAMSEVQKVGGISVVCLGEGQATPRSLGSGPPEFDPLETARRYMDDNFRKPLSLDEIAAHAGISAGYFCRRFKQRYQITPIMYLRNLRIARATHLLLHTDLALPEITDQSGFFSVSYFCREFHKAKGMAPIAFRRKHSAAKIF